jgi:hypothetical protein
MGCVQNSVSYFINQFRSHFTGQQLLLYVLIVNSVVVSVISQNSLFHAVWTDTKVVSSIMSDFDEVVCIS